MTSAWLRPVDRSRDSWCCSSRHPTRGPSTEGEPLRRRRRCLLRPCLRVRVAAGLPRPSKPPRTCAAWRCSAALCGSCSAAGAGTGPRRLRTRLPPHRRPRGAASVHAHEHAHHPSAVDSHAEGAVAAAGVVAAAAPAACRGVAGKAAAAAPGRSVA